MARSAVDDAFIEFRRKLDSLSRELDKVAGDTEAASSEALDAFQQIVTEAEAERDRRIAEAKVLFAARLASLHPHLLEVHPVSKENSSSPPTFRAAYSDRTALLMAKLAMLSYERFELGPSYLEILRTKLEIGGLQLVGVFSNKGTQGFVCKTDALIGLVFRGTTDGLDWRTNVDTRRVIIKNHPRHVRAHQGFLRAYLDAEPEILALISSAPALPIYIAGHSLGGALALVASAALPLEDSIDNDRMAAVYTFGSPRVGGGDFSQIIKAPHYRVCNPWDIVPAVPPVWLGFRHSGDTRYLARDDRVPSDSKPVLGGLVSFGILRSAYIRLRGSNRTALAQHDIKRYIVKLEAIMQARRDWQTMTVRRAETAKGTVGAVKLAK